jgi:hypothetical protein
VGHMDARKRKPGGCGVMDSTAMNRARWSSLPHANLKLAAIAAIQHSKKFLWSANLTKRKFSSWDQLDRRMFRNLIVDQGWITSSTRTDWCFASW